MRRDSVPPPCPRPALPAPGVDEAKVSTASAAEEMDLAGARLVLAFAFIVALSAASGARSPDELIGTLVILAVIMALGAGTELRRRSTAPRR